MMTTCEVEQFTDQQIAEMVQHAVVVGFNIHNMLVGDDMPSQQYMCAEILSSQGSTLVGFVARAGSGGSNGRVYCTMVCGNETVTDFNWTMQQFMQLDSADVSRMQQQLSAANNAYQQALDNIATLNQLINDQIKQPKPFLSRDVQCDLADAGDIK